MVGHSDKTLFLRCNVNLKAFELHDYKGTYINIHFAVFFFFFGIFLFPQMCAVLVPQHSR